MKVKNIMFSGVMAAILMTVAGAANAADGVISVASTGYVDAKVGEVDTKVGTIPQGGFTVGSANYADVAQAITALDTKTAGVVGETDMKNIQDSIATLTGGEDKEGSVKYQIKAVEEAQKLVDDAQDEKITANEDAIIKLNANAETEGSVAYQIAQAVSDDALAKYTTDAELEGKGYQTALDVQAAISDLKLGENYQTKLDATQMAAVDSGVTAEKVSGYDSAVSAVNDTTSGLSATYAIATANKTAIEATDTGLAAAHTAIDNLETDKQAKLTADNLKGDGAAGVSIAEDGVITISATDTTYTAGTNVTLGEGNSINVTMAESVAAGGDAAVSAAQVQGYAIPKPGTNCSKTTCVLTVDQANGQPYWMELALSL